MSHRFGKLLHTDSVVLKETSGWEEYYYRALTPWVHYVPVSTICTVFMLPLSSVQLPATERTCVSFRQAERS